MGATVVVGPGLPYTDPTMQRPGVLDRYLTAPGTAQIGRGRLIWVGREGLAQLLAEIAPAPEYSSSDPSLKITTWRNGCKRCPCR